MRKARPFLASLLLHAAAFGLGVLCLTRAPSAPRAPVAIEMTVLPPTAGNVRSEAAGSAPGEAGRPAAGERASDSARPAALAPHIEPPPRVDESAVAVPRATPGLAIAPGEVNILADAGEGGDGRGGRGGGAGVGGGGGGTRAVPAWTRLAVADFAQPPAPAAPPRPRSRARPARLIYPKLLRRERPGEVFVAILTVDREGFVDGVELEQGVSPNQDEKALDAVWRFRYEPALDHAGRPTASRVHQRFMLR